MRLTQASVVSSQKARIRSSVTPASASAASSGPRASSSSIAASSRPARPRWRRSMRGKRS